MIPGENVQYPVAGSSIKGHPARVGLIEGSLTVEEIAVLWR
jgi:hypothetical protein